MKTVMLTFDIEECDFFTSDDKFTISKQGTETILNILDKRKIKGTFFVTSAFALKYKKLISDIYKSGHEIASHGHTHEHDYGDMTGNAAYNYIINSKKIIEKIINAKIFGFRAPRLHPPNYNILKSIGFEYDSSYHPTYVPGRYNNFLGNRNIHDIDGVKIVPISVTPYVRLPLSWFWFRNIGLNYAKYCTTSIFKKGGFLNIYFHPWDFVDMSKADCGGMIKRNTGSIMIDMFSRYIDWLSGIGVKFDTIKNYIGDNNGL
jgi:peptidoglycan/xylan/chitin deacetylase (PgdA/CDA1 family)